MKAYFMLGQSVPMGFAVIAALDIPEIIGRLTGSAETQYSLLDDREFERIRDLSRRDRPLVQTA